MSNVIVSLAMPAFNGAGAAVDTSTMAREKTLILEGTMLDATVTVQGSVDGGVTYFPIPTAVFAKTGKIVVVVACDHMRAFVSGRKTNFPFTPTEVGVSAPTGTGLFANLPLPVLNGAGASVDVSAHGSFSTFAVNGTFPEATVQIQASNDGSSWATVLTFADKGGQVSLTETSNFYRTFVSGRTAQMAFAATADVGSIDDPAGGGGSFPDITDTAGVEVTIFDQSITPEGMVTTGFDETSGGVWNDPAKWAVEGSASGQIDNWDPGAGAFSTGEVSIIVQPAPSAGLTITGLVADVPAGFPAILGRIVTIINPGRPGGSLGGQGSITIVTNSGASDPANRFLLTANLLIPIRSSATFIYTDLNGTGWKLLSVSKDSSFPDITDSAGSYVEIGNSTYPGVLQAYVGLAGFSPLLASGCSFSINDGCLVFNGISLPTASPLAAVQEDWDFVGPNPAPFTLNYVSTQGGGSSLGGVVNRFGTLYPALNTYAAVFTFFNQGPGSVTLLHESLGSTANQRLLLPGAASKVIPIGGSFTLVYDGNATQRWRLLSAVV